MYTRTHTDVKNQLWRDGMTGLQWAQAHDVSYECLRNVLSGRSKGQRGEAHNIMVLLKMKHGRINPLYRGKK